MNLSGEDKRLLAAVRIGGAEAFGLSFPWAFAYKQK